MEDDEDINPNKRPRVGGPYDEKDKQIDELTMKFKFICEENINLKKTIDELILRIKNGSKPGEKTSSQDDMLVDEPHTRKNKKKTK